MMTKLTLAALASLEGGRVREAFDRELKRCEDDCRDRPTNQKARKLTIVLTMTPYTDSDGVDLFGVDVGVQIKAAVPPKETRKYDMRAASGGGLEFNDMSPDNARQGTLDQVKAARAAEGGGQ